MGNYVADALGFRVAGDNLPVGPVDTAVAPVHAIAPVVDTPEVVEAKAAFFQAYEAAKSGIVKREAQVLAAPISLCWLWLCCPSCLCRIWLCCSSCCHLCCCPSRCCPSCCCHLCCCSSYCCPSCCHLCCCSSCCCPSCCCCLCCSSCPSP